MAEGADAGTTEQTTTEVPDESLAGGDIETTEEKSEGAESAGKDEGKSKEAKEGKEGEGDKGSQSDEDKTGAAKDFEPKLPEGVTPDEALLTPFKSIVKELGVPHEAAQKMVDLWAKTQADTEAANETGFKQERQQWREDLKKDKEFGGAKFQASVNGVRGLVSQFGGAETKELRDLMNKGLGDQPLVFRFLARIAAANAEDSLKGVNGKSGGHEQPSEQERLYRRYETMRPKET